MKNYCLPEPSDERIGEIKKLLNELESRTDFLLELSLDERCALPKLDEDRERFTQEALLLGKQYPECLPPHSEVDRLLEGMAFRREVKELFEKSNTVTERLDDSIVASGSQAYVVALNVVQALEVRAKADPSLQGELEQLRRLFEPWENILH